VAENGGELRKGLVIIEIGVLEFLRTTKLRLSRISAQWERGWKKIKGFHMDLKRFQHSYRIVVDLGCG
jgi:hypothetical protein